MLERGPKDLVELTTWAQKYLIAHKQQLLIAHKQQLGGKSKTTVQPRRADPSPIQIRFKDARGRYSATVVIDLDTGNQNVVQRLVLTRFRRVH